MGERVEWSVQIVLWEWSLRRVMGLAVRCYLGSDAGMRSSRRGFKRWKMSCY